MTSSKALFKQMFLQKRRYANLILLIQVFAVVFMFLMGIIFKGSNNLVNNFAGLIADNSNSWDLLLGIGTITTFLADVALFCLLCWQNEKINLSQTWQLIPTSSSKIWVINIFSSLIECAYLFVIQIVLGLVVLIFDSYSHHIPFFTRSDFTINHDSLSAISGVFEELLGLIGLCLLIFVFISLANFLTRIIVDQLPVKSTTGIKLIVMAVLVIVAVFIAAQVNDQVTIMYYNHLVAHSKTLDMDLIGVTALEYWIGAIILGIINCLLVQKFVESKIINR
ncbi:hypothetical protein [Lactobacillus ultunensis]|uniref:Uncharacterized protein n=1 Tax=Lactobacillus ultunensis DSM 16047 TaxID=525365 RepID=C2EK62_9LACO|nr:hypothetical protein [Lactobacillus ultunensis]EEJ73077.1 hypothetical protein HMPREF0548_0058 [Lactobacillus ultunensis DSM 16047]KRL82654.1 ABC superfamily ATP binding cassette transporter permease [Lactobacillus ultunensis DSM 16047]QQP29405.1 ABC transporter permease [Lactobacillus ultunensis]